MELSLPIINKLAPLPPWVVDEADMVEWRDHERRTLYCWVCEEPVEESFCRHLYLVRPSVWKKFCTPIGIDPKLLVPSQLEVPRTPPRHQAEAETNTLEDEEWEFSFELADDHTPSERRFVTPVRDLEKGDGDEYRPGTRSTRRTVKSQKSPKSRRHKSANSTPSTPRKGGRPCKEKISPRQLYGGKAYVLGEEIYTPLSSPRRTNKGEPKRPKKASPYSVEALSVSWGLE